MKLAPPPPQLALAVALSRPELELACLEPGAWVSVDRKKWRSRGLHSKSGSLESASAQEAGGLREGLLNEPYSLANLCLFLLSLGQAKRTSGESIH